MPHVKEATKVRIWANKEADVEEVTFLPEMMLTVIEDWGQLLLLKDAEGRTFQLRADQVVR